MNDYTFGNRLCDLRRRAGLTQAELAEKLGITNKAVSKWENGRAKPTTDLIRKLAALYGVKVEELLREKEGEKKMEITKIVITGGPCAGKTTAMNWIQGHLAAGDQSGDIFCLRSGQTEGKAESEQRVRPPCAGENPVSVGGHWRQRRCSAGDEGVAS